MASPTSSRKKKKSNKQFSDVDSPVLNGVAAALIDSLQPIQWREVGKDLRQRRSQLRRIWDWSKPAKNPLTWGISNQSLALLHPFSKGLADCWNKQAPTSKQRSQVEQLLQKWVDEAPLRLQRLPGHPETSNVATQQRETWQLGLEAIAVAWLLPAFHNASNTRLVEEACAILLELGDAATVPGECPVGSGLWQIEVPLVLSALLPGDVFPTSLKLQALQLLKQQIEELTDGNGMPSHTQLSLLAPLLAGWTRVWRLERYVPELRSDVPTRDRYRLALQNYLRMLRCDGTLLNSDPSVKPIDEMMVAIWMQLGQDAEERTIAQWTCPANSIIRDLPGARLKEHQLSDAADYSEWGKLAVLRSRWKRKSDRLSVGFGQPKVQIELHNKRSWLAGFMETHILLNDQPLPLGENWEEICWQSDEDIIYIELQNTLPNEQGLLQRQISLARKDRLCLLADAVLLNPAAQNQQSQQLTHRLILPLAPGVDFQTSTETRDGWLEDGKSRLSVLPLTLPEWRVQGARGKMEFNKSEHAIALEHSLPSHRLYAAIMIDLDSKRSQRPLGWRQLTVGENLQPVPIDQAFGTRVQLHRQQYLVYRSLTPPTSRSLLGQNIYSDFYWGRFLPNGIAQTMIMIESS